MFLPGGAGVVPGVVAGVESGARINYNIIGRKGRYTIIQNHTNTNTDVTMRSFFLFVILDIPKRK